MKIYSLSIFLLSLSLFSCKNDTATSKKVVTAPVVEQTAMPKFQNKGHELVYNFVQKVGTYQNLLDKKDVVYTYTYQTPDGKKDIATEKYIFQNELSYG